MLKKIRGITNRISPLNKLAKAALKHKNNQIILFGYYHRIYCAFNSETAIAETVDTNNKDKGNFTTAVFRAKRILKVIDFTDLPVPPSMFDVENFKNYYSTRFLRDFVNDISKTIKRDGKEHIDYVPTQIVTEYFRYIYKGDVQIDGLIYPSAKIENAKCCVLFFDNERSLEELKLIPSSLVTKSINDIL